MSDAFPTYEVRWRRHLTSMVRRVGISDLGAEWVFDRTFDYYAMDMTSSTARCRVFTLTAELSADDEQHFIKVPEGTVTLFVAYRTTLESRLVDELRSSRRTRRAPMPPSDDHPGRADGDLPVMLNQILRFIDAHFDEHHPGGRHAEVFRLHAMNYSTREIARALSEDGQTLSEGTVRNRLSDLRALLDTL